MDENTDNCTSKKLFYKIHKCSSYSNNKQPENIIHNDPSDQESRWYTDSTEPNQYILLELHTIAIVDSIHFGKYLKAHTTDLKKFNIYGGYEEDNMQLLLKAGLKNDNRPEMFNLRYCTSDGFLVPIRYIKIIPLKSWGNTNNYSIWHVALYGRNDEKLMKHCLETIHLRKERETIRIILRYLRRRKYVDAQEALMRESGVSLEGPRQERFWNALVEEANFEEAENIFTEAANEGELEWYISWQRYKPVWERIMGCSPEIEVKLLNTSLTMTTSLNNDTISNLTLHTTTNRLNSESYTVEELMKIEKSFSKNENRPGPRGGHQLVMDSIDNKIYLYAGWSGTKELDDLWMYDVANRTWVLLCEHSGELGGPPPTSCHKVVLDQINKKLYTLGRYIDSSRRHSDNMKNDFYFYDLIENQWRLICDDISKVGGPPLVYDHQMCIDTDTQTIYLFGGRLITGTPYVSGEEGYRYSGLYAYHIKTNTWRMITNEPQTKDAPVPRVGHIMTFHSIQKRLYIFAGTANKELLMGLWFWDVRTGECGILTRSRSKSATPAPSFTQRATIDTDTNEMFVFAGMTKDKRVFNTLWVFSLDRLTWSCVYTTEVTSKKNPRPRFAHQFVYDYIRKVHYLFGGNPGHQHCAQQRLDDLWSLKLSKRTADELVNRARVLLREARYKQLALNADPKAAVEALEYLRHTVRATIDPDDPVQLDHYHRLTTALFVAPEETALISRPLSPGLVEELEGRKVRFPEQSATDVSQAIDAILTQDNVSLENPIPFEYIPDAAAKVTMPATLTPHDPTYRDREARIEVYDELCQYFKPSVVPPNADIGDLVDF